MALARRPGSIGANGGSVDVTEICAYAEVTVRRLGPIRRSACARSKGVVSRSAARLSSVAKCRPAKLTGRQDGYDFSSMSLEPKTH